MIYLFLIFIISINFTGDNNLIFDVKLLENKYFEKNYHQENITKLEKLQIDIIKQRSILNSIRLDSNLIDEGRKQHFGTIFDLLLNIFKSQFIMVEGFLTSIIPAIIREKTLIIKFTDEINTLKLLKESQVHKKKVLQEISEKETEAVKNLDESSERFKNYSSIFKSMLCEKNSENWKSKLDEKDFDTFYEKIKQKKIKMKEHIKSLENFRYEIEKEAISSEGKFLRKVLPAQAVGFLILSQMKFLLDNNFGEIGNFYCISSSLPLLKDIQSHPEFNNLREKFSFCFKVLEEKSSIRELGYISFSLQDTNEDFNELSNIFKNINIDSLIDRIYRDFLQTDNFPKEWDLLYSYISDSLYSSLAFSSFIRENMSRMIFKSEALKKKYEIDSLMKNIKNIFLAIHSIILCINDYKIDCVIEDASSKEIYDKNINEDTALLNINIQKMFDMILKLFSDYGDEDLDGKQLLKEDREIALPIIVKNVKSLNTADQQKIIKFFALELDKEDQKEKDNFLNALKLDKEDEKEKDNFLNALKLDKEDEKEKDNFLKILLKFLNNNLKKIFGIGIFCVVIILVVLLKKKIIFTVK